MANGDLSSATADAKGVYLTLVFTGMGVCGTSGYSLDALNATAPDGARCLTQTSSAKIVLSVKKPKNDGTGTASAAAADASPRPVYGTIVRYKEAPPANSYAPDESAGGGNLAVVVVLSEELQSSDVATLTLLSGFANDGSVTSNATSGVSVNLASVTTGYGKPVVRWACKPKQRIKPGDDLTLSAFARHPYGIALVRFTVTDEHSHTVTADVTSVTDRTSAVSGLSVGLHTAAIATTTFTTGDVLTANVKVYPATGDSTAIEDSSTTGATFPSLTLCPWPYWLAADSERTYAAVSVATGNNGTGAASPTYATAIASPFADCAAAITAIKSYNNTNHTRNDLGAGEVVLIDGSLTTTFANETTATKAVMRIRMADGVANTVAKFTTTGSKYIPRFTEFLGIRFAPTDAANQLMWWVATGGHADGAELTVQDQCVYVGPDVTSGTNYADGGFNIHIDTLMTNYKNGLNTNGGDNYTLLSMGCDVSGHGQYALNEHRAPLANKVHAPVAGANDGGWQVLLVGSSNIAEENNVIDVSDGLALKLGTPCDRRWHCGSRHRRITGSVPSSLIEMSSFDQTDVTFANNSVRGADTGGRVNLEDDITVATPTQIAKRFHVRNNAVNQGINTREHSTANAEAGTGWKPMTYGVNWAANVVYQATANNYYWGRNFSTADPLFTNGATGDLSLQAGSPARNRVPAGLIEHAYDSAGTTIPDDGTGAAGALQPAAVVSGLLLKRRRAVLAMA